MSKIEEKADLFCDGLKEKGISEEEQLCASAGYCCGARWQLGDDIETIIAWIKKHTIESKESGCVFTDFTSKEAMIKDLMTIFYESN